MIAAHGEQRYSLLQDHCGLCSDLVGDALRAAKVKAEIAIVNDGQPFSGVKAPRPGSEIREMRRGGTNAGGTEARTGPVGGGEIVRHTDDGDVDAAQLLGVAPAQKAERASVGVFPMHAV